MIHTIDFTIKQDDLKALFILTGFAYGNLSFKEWVKECQENYKYFALKKEHPKTFSQWVNGQIIALNC